MPGTRAEDDHAARYAALYREHNRRLVAYARSLTGSAAVAEDLAAEAHFRVWRRIRAGHEVDNVAAYLTTTVRNLAAGRGRARREITGEVADLAELPRDPARDRAIKDPERRASHVDLISRLLKELPERWARALWYAEVEDLPLEAVGERIGAGASTTAVVLTRARERLRQAFLQSQPGMPRSEACEPYWKQMPTLVRGTASSRRTKHLADHCDECADCRARMLALTEANTRLPALLGPAILAGVLGGGSRPLPTVGIGAATGAAATAGTARTAVRTGSKARHARISPRTHLLKHGLSPAKAVLAGSAAAVCIVATVVTLALGSASASSQTPAASAPLTAPAFIEPTSAPSGTTSSSAAAAGPSTTASAVAQPTSAAMTSATSLQESSAANSVSSPSGSSAATTDPTTDTTVVASTSTDPATSPSPGTASSSATAVAGPVAVNSPSAGASSTSASPTSASPTPSPTTSSASATASASDTPTATPSVTPTPTLSPTVSPTVSPTLTSTLSPSSSPS